MQYNDTYNLIKAKLKTNSAKNLEQTKAPKMPRTKLCYFMTRAFKHISKGPNL